MILHYAYAGAALIALALLAAWMFIVSQRHVATRVFGCVIAVTLAFGVWTNIAAMLGYAVSAVPQGKVKVIGFESDPSHGRIFVWVSEASGPRAYALPYDQDLASEMIAGMKKTRDGSTVMMLSRGKKDGKKSGKGQGNGRQGNGTSNSDGHTGQRNGNSVSNLGGDNSDGTFHIDLEPTLPPKDE